MSLVFAIRIVSIFLVSALIWAHLSINMPMDDFELTDNIPISVIKGFYPLKGPYRGQKKTSEGKPLPFERIDKSLYKKNANCVCFLTNEKRIHAWIKALHEVIYLKYGESDQFNVIWRDIVDDTGLITNTEFLFHDKSQSEEKFKYKVCVYVTTGSIMVQGNSYLQFCNEEFEQCISKVSQILDQETAIEPVGATLKNNEDSEQTYVKQIVENDQDSAEHNPNDSLGSLDISHDTLYMGHEGFKSDYRADTTKTVVMESKSTDCAVKSKEVKLTEDMSKRIGKIEEAVLNLTTIINKTVMENTDIGDNSMFMKSINTRIDTIEDTVLNLSDTVTKFVESIAKSKVSQPSDVEKLQHKLEKLELDKVKNSEDVNKQKEAWSRKLKDLEIKYNASQCERISHTEQSRQKLSDLSNKLEKAEHLVEQKSSVIRELENKIENQKDIINELDSDKKVLSARLQDRDRIIEQTAERVQMARYDREGGAWAMSRPQSPSRETSVRETAENGILLLHDSICKYVDLKLFTAATECVGKEKKIRCSTIDVIATSMADISGKFDHIIIHVGVNDLRSQNITVGQVFNKYEEMVQEVKIRAVA